MKPLSISLSVSLSMGVLLAALVGCAGNGTTTGATSTSGAGGFGGSGGSGGGPNIDYPPCQDNQAVFTGELDGQPFDKTIPTKATSLDQGSDPPYVTIFFLDSGKLHLIWKGLAEPEKLKATTGYMILPSDMIEREVLTGSTVIVESDRRFFVELFMDQGHLIGCIRPLI